MKKFYFIFAVVVLMAGFSISASAQGCNSRPACSHPRVVVAKANANASGGTQGYAVRFRNVVDTSGTAGVRVNNLANLEAIRRRAKTATPNAAIQDNSIIGGRKQRIFKGEITGVEAM
jgi:hypothetical protein